MPGENEISTEVLRKASGSAKKLTKNINKRFRAFLNSAGIGRREWEEFCDKAPHFAAQLRQKLCRKFEMGLIPVYDALFLKAVNGNPAAIKLYFQRFDPEFVERKQTTHDFADDDPTSESIHRIMVAAHGDEWVLAARFSKAKKNLGGVLGEEFLEGGRDEETDFGTNLPEPAKTIEGEATVRDADISVDEMFDFEEEE